LPRVSGSCSSRRNHFDGDATYASSNAATISTSTTTTGEQKNKNADKTWKKNVPMQEAPLWDAARFSGGSENGGPLMNRRILFRGAENTTLCFSKS
jgi:hypothetical protein